MEKELIVLVRLIQDKQRRHGINLWRPPLPGLKHLVGESIRYVALLNGQWVALLGWTSTTCQPRSSGSVDRL
jgi:hypothetical protein